MTKESMEEKKALKKYLMKGIMRLDQQMQPLRDRLKLMKSEREIIARIIKAIN